MKMFEVYCNACHFGFIEANDEQEARNIAARMAGYESEADMIERTGQPSELVAVQFTAYHQVQL